MGKMELEEKIEYDDNTSFRQNPEQQKPVAKANSFEEKACHQPIAYLSDLPMSLIAKVAGYAVFGPAKSELEKVSKMFLKSLQIYPNELVMPDRPGGVVTGTHSEADGLYEMSDWSDRLFVKKDEHRPGCCEIRIVKNNRWVVTSSSGEILYFAPKVRTPGKNRGDLTDCLAAINKGSITWYPDAALIRTIGAKDENGIIPLPKVFYLDPRGVSLENVSG